MCGLVGMAGDLNGGHDKVLKSLLVLDSLRGEDSTGVAFVQKYTGTVTVAKQLGDPFNLFNDNKFSTNLNKVNRCLIGHNRYATVGGVSKASAHPFDFDTLVGVHNGTLSSKWKLEDHTDYKVDSAALYHNIEKNGLQAAINLLGADGNAWSLVWWDKEESTLNFLRNKERPMFMCRSEDGKVLFWASETWMLEAALNRSSVKYGPIFLTDVDTHYSVFIDNKGVMDKPRLTRVAAPPPPVYHPPVNQHTNRPAHIVKQVGNVVALPNNTATADTTATSKGVVEQKKPNEGSGSRCDASYVNSNYRTFEVLARHSDGNGSEYVSLFDPMSPYVDIRLYPHKFDGWIYDMVGYDIEGQISSYGQEDKKAIRGYYKVNPLTIHKKKSAVKEEQEELFPTHRGQLVKEAEWKEQYSLCAWCSDELKPTDNNRYTTGGECVCPSCVKNPEVVMYVNLV